MALPFQLLIVFFFFKKYKFSILECAVVVLYLEGTSSFAQALISPLYGLLDLSLASLFSIAIIPYSIIVLKRFFSSSWIRATIAYLFYYLALITSIAIGTITVLVLQNFSENAI